MLIPKRVKRRKQHRGNIKGQAQKGNKVAYGEYGLVAAEGARITSRQIEAARIAMTRFIKRGGQVRGGSYRDDPFHQARRSGLDRYIPAQADHASPRRVPYGFR